MSFLSKALNVGSVLSNWIAPETSLIREEIGLSRSLLRRTRRVRKNIIPTTHGTLLRRQSEPIPLLRSPSSTTHGALLRRPSTGPSLCRHCSASQTHELSRNKQSLVSPHFVHELEKIARRGYTMLDVKPVSLKRASFYIPDHFQGMHHPSPLYIGPRNFHLEQRPDFFRMKHFMLQVAPEHTKYLSIQARYLKEAGIEYVYGVQYDDTIVINSIERHGLPSHLQTGLHEVAHQVNLKAGIVETEYGNHGPEFFATHNAIVHRLYLSGHLAPEEFTQLTMEAYHAFGDNIYEQISPFWWLQLLSSN